MSDSKNDADVRTMFKRSVERYPELGEAHELADALDALADATYGRRHTVSLSAGQAFRRHASGLERRRPLAGQSGPADPLDCCGERSLWVDSSDPNGQVGWLAECDTIGRVAS